MMCHNHSHVAGHLVGVVAGEDDTEYEILVEQPLTLELSSGAKLTLPPYTTCVVRQAHPGALSDLVHQLMVEQADAGLFRTASRPPSGRTTQAR